MSAGVGILIVVGAFFSVLATLNLWIADLTSPRRDGGPTRYVTDVRAHYRFWRFREFSALQTLDGGFVRLQIRGEVVRIGASGRLRVFAAAIGLSHRLEARRFQAKRGWVDTAPLRHRKAEGVILTGRNRHGCFLQYEVVPRDGDVENLLRELAGAGAQVNLSSASPKHSKPSLSEDSLDR